jgi:putative MATE family efflux protein
MRDLTQGSIPRHLMSMAGFIGFGLIVQTMLLLVDLFFVARLGEHAVAGVATGGSAMMIVMAASQLIGVGSLSLIARATGAKDMAMAQAVFDQSVSMAVFAAIVTLLLGYLLGTAFVGLLAADPLTAAAGRDYLFAFLPSLALMFVNGSIGSGLRATGVVGAPMAIQSGTVALNILLAPVLIAGWGTGMPLGVGGAGLASSIATACGSLALIVLFGRMQQHLRLERQALVPRFALWKRITAIGLPSSTEFLLMFLVSGVIYWSIRRFGPEAQAGFGIGSRVMQSIFLPAMAVAFAASPIAGQNHGAGRSDRVRATVKHAMLIGSAIMAVLTLFCQWRPEVLIHIFTHDEGVVLVAADYLRVISWNFVATGLVFCCSGMFQALGDTTPSLISSTSRILTFVLPVIYLSARTHATLHDVWRLSNISVAVQALISLALLRREFGRKLKPVVAAE